MMIIRPGRILKLVVLMPWILLCSSVACMSGFMSILFLLQGDWFILVLFLLGTIGSVQILLYTIHGIYKDLSYKSIFIQPFVDKKDHDQKKETLWWWDK